MSSDPLPECLECGACCFSELETYARVTGDDHARMGPRAEELVRFVGNRAYLRVENGRCAALRVDHDTATFPCSAYEIRPAVCRQLVRGSPECLGEIATKAERPRRILRP